MVMAPVPFVKRGCAMIGNKGMDNLNGKNDSNQRQTDAHQHNIMTGVLIAAKLSRGEYSHP
jgi:hypothetical protein